MKRNPLSFAVLALGLVACSQDNLQLEILETSPPVISKEEVEPGSTNVPLKLAEKVALSTRPGTRSGIDVQDIRTVFTDDGEPAFHAVNFANSNGFVLVSASQNYTPVLAEVKSGTFDLLNIPGNVRFYLEGYKHAIKACNKAPEDSVKYYRMQWKEYLAEETTVQKPVTRSSDPYLDAFIFDEQREWNNNGYYYASLKSNTLEVYFYEDIKMEVEDRFPDVDLSTCFIVLRPQIENLTIPDLIETKWNEGPPYNEMLGNNVLGTGPVSMGQVMKYNKKPASYSWDKMPVKYEISNTAPVLSTFLKELYDKTNTRPLDINTSQTDAPNIVQALKNYGYQDATLINDDPETIYQNILNKKPVIGVGEEYTSPVKQYNWVYTGAEKKSKYYYYFVHIPQPDPTKFFKYDWEIIDLSHLGIESSGIPSIYFSINWCKGGKCDGWFYGNCLIFVDNDNTIHDVYKNKNVTGIK